MFDPYVFRTSDPYPTDPLPMIRTANRYPTDRLLIICTTDPYSTDRHRTWIVGAESDASGKTFFCADFLFRLVKDMLLFGKKCYRSRC